MGGVAWTEEEDDLLRKCIEQYGEGKWHRVPLLAGLNRCRKSCRLRWLNYLRPNIRRGRFTEEEVRLIIKLHNLLGNRWSLIAGQLRGRTANDVKNFWNCHLSKKFTIPHQGYTTTSSSSSKKQQKADTPETSLTSGTNNTPDTPETSLAHSEKKKTTKLPSSFNGSEYTGARSQATSTTVQITAHGHEYEYDSHHDYGHGESTSMCKPYQGSVLASSLFSENVDVPYPNYNGTNHVDCDTSDMNSLQYYIDDQINKEENRGRNQGGNYQLHRHGSISPEDDEFVVNFEFDEIKMCGEQRKISKWDLDDVMIMDMDSWANQALL